MYCRFVRKNSIVCYHLHIFFQHLLVDLDVILATDGNFLLGKWIREARKQGKSIKSWAHLTLPYRRERQKRRFRFLCFIEILMDYIYIYLAVFPAGSFFGGVKNEEVFFSFRVRIFLLRVLPLCFFFARLVLKRNTGWGKEGAPPPKLNLRKEKADGKWREEEQNFSFTRPLVGTGSYWTLMEQQPVSQVFGNPFGTFVFFFASTGLRGRESDLYEFNARNQAIENPIRFLGKNIDTYIPGDPLGPPAGDPHPWLCRQAVVWAGIALLCAKVETLLQVN